MPKAKKAYHLVENKSGTHIDSKVRIITVIKLATNNDTNGNPRRVWVVLNSTPNEVSPVALAGNIITAIDEGYEGDAGVHRFIKERMEPWYETLVVWGPTFTTTPSEYRATLKHNKGSKQLAVPKEVQIHEGDFVGAPELVVSDDDITAAEEKLALARNVARTEVDKIVGKKKSKKK